MARNVEQFSHAGSTPFGSTPLGKELVHTGDSPMANKIYNGTLEHEALNDEAINSIVTQLRKHSAIQQILSPIVTEEDFKSAFKCVQKNSIVLFRARSPSLQGMFRSITGWYCIPGSSCTRGYDDSAPRCRVLPRTLETSSGCNTREDTSCRSLQQTKDHTIARSGPKSSHMHRVRNKHYKVCKRALSNNLRSPLWEVQQHLFDTCIEQTVNCTTPHTEED
jgi:hypothetical protein